MLYFYVVYPGSGLTKIKKNKKEEKYIVIPIKILKTWNMKKVTVVANLMDASSTSLRKLGKHQRGMVARNVVLLSKARIL